jgi:hypothetical protein
MEIKETFPTIAMSAFRNGINFAQNVSLINVTGGKIGKCVLSGIVW